MRASSSTVWAAAAPGRGASPGGRGGRGAAAPGVPPVWGKERGWVKAAPRAAEVLKAAFVR